MEDIESLVIIGVQTMETDYLFKMVLVGNMSVGKTSLVLRYTDDSFSTNYKTTIGVDFKVKTLDMGRDGLVKLQIWDTGGQERFRSIVSSFYRGTDGLIVVYDITDKGSFEHVTHWYREAQYNGLDSYNIQCPLLLVGNKSDLTMERAVTFQEGQALAQQLGMSFIETSAKDKTNVEQAFLCMARSILEVRKGNPTLQEESLGSFQLPINEGTDVQDSWYNYYNCC